MAKYARQQLKAMAIAVLEAKTNNDPRYFDFMFQLSMRTGRSYAYIEEMVTTYMKRC